jgi:hypothetical protein
MIRSVSQKTLSSVLRPPHNPLTPSGKGIVRIGHVSMAMRCAVRLINRTAENIRARNGPLLGNCQALD